MAVAPASGSLTAAERRLRVVLRVFAVVLGMSAVVYAVGPLIHTFRGTFRELPFVDNSVVKVSVLGLCCLYASGNVRRRRGLITIVIAGHFVSVASMLFMLAFGPVNRSLTIGSSTVSIKSALWGAIALDGVITLAVIVFYLLARPPKPHPRSPDAPPHVGRSGLTGPERLLQVVAYVLGAFFVIGGVVYLVGPLIHDSDRFFVDLPYVTNSVVKVATLAMLVIYVARDMRGNLPVMGVVVGVHFLSPVVCLAYLQFLDTDYSLPVGSSHVRMNDLLWSWGASDLAVGVLLLVLLRRAWRARYGLQFLTPAEYRALESVADVVIAGPDEAIPPGDIAANVERYLEKVKAHRRWVYRVALGAMYAHPLLFAKPPLPELEASLRRDHLKHHFQRPPRWPPILNSWIRAAIRVGQQISYAGYYNDPRTFESVGYKPFSQRDRIKGLAIPAPHEHPLDVHTPERVTETELEADVCIVGSGAGGSILAYEMAKRGHSVLILERGEYVQPREFHEDEMAMVTRLYRDGVMQQTKDFRFTILQGSCVGGSTTVNNAVCFEPPAHVMARWNDPELHDARIDLGDLQKSVEHLNEFLHIQRQGPPTRLNPGAQVFVDGAANVPPSELHADIVRANIEGCFGSGYCNIGCPWGKKLSMLDTVLPWAQRDYPGRVTIVSECEVKTIRTRSGDERAVTGLNGVLPDGRKLTVHAKTYVLSAGALASSYLLMRSGVNGGLPVGEHLCFNMGSPLTAEVDYKVDSYDGLQISHFGLPPGGEFAFETWFNPPVSQAVNLPGWFEDHYANMRNYDHLLAAGVIVGTKGNARVKKALTGGPDVDYTPDPGDLRTLARGLHLLAQILFDGGAKRVMLNTWGYDVFEPGDDLARLDRLVQTPGYMTLGTGHPQGGNAMSHDSKRGVVGPDFRVHGFSNLYICDASVFPSSLTVNPQMTVMTLAHYAADRVKVGV
jgi:choline dehydrogenase-like flavoprotein